MTSTLSAPDLRSLLLRTLSCGALVLVLRLLSFFARFSGPPPRHRATSPLRTRWQRWKTLVASRPPTAPPPGPDRRAEPLRVPEQRSRPRCRLRPYREVIGYAWPTHDHDLARPFVSPEPGSEATAPLAPLAPLAPVLPAGSVVVWPDADPGPGEPVWVDPAHVLAASPAADPWRSPPSPAGAHAGAAR